MADSGVEALREDLARSLAVRPWGEAAAVAVLLGFAPVAAHPRFARYADRGGVNWTAALKDPAWSEGQRFLIASGAGLWTGLPRGADVFCVPFLDDDFYRVWLAMVTAARTGKVPDGR